MAVLRNVNTVRQNLIRQRTAMVLKFNIGMKKCGLVLQAMAQKIVPVDTGNLRASAFTYVGPMDGQHITVVVGFLAEYAVYVHENLDAAHGAVFNAKYAAELAARKKARRGGAKGYSPFNHNRGPDQTAKYLEKPFREMQIMGTYKTIIHAEMAA